MSISFITEDKVEWMLQWSDSQIAKGRLREASAKERFYAKSAEEPMASKKTEPKAKK